MSGLTEEELDALELGGELAVVLRRIVGNERTRESDLGELIGHIDAILEAIIQQATARAYPDRFRLLGDVLQ